MNDVKAQITNMRNLVTDLNNDQVLQLQRLAGIEEDLNIIKSHDGQGEVKMVELVAELYKNISAVNVTTLKVMNDVKALCAQRMRNFIKKWSSKVDILTNQVLYLQRLLDTERDISATKSCDQTEGELVELVTGL